MMLTLLYWIIIGGIAGWLASLIMGSRQGLLGNILIGIVGAILGGLLFGLLGLGGAGLLWSLFTATVGAVILLAIVNAFQRRAPRTTTM